MIDDLRTELVPHHDIALQVHREERAGAPGESEHELDRSLAGQRMLVLCTYSLQASRAVDLLDVARAHGFTYMIFTTVRWADGAGPERPAP